MNRNLQTVSELAKNSPFTEGQIRWWIFNAESNGMNEHNAVTRVGRRVYIDPEGFDGWIASQQTRAAA